MEDSILTSTKQVLGIASDVTAFDVDVITHINTAFSNLTQLGIGPANGFMITGVDETWDDFVSGDDPQWNSVRTYIYLKTRSYFDPPTTSYLKDAMMDQIREIEVRLNMHREETAWGIPT